MSAKSTSRICHSTDFHKSKPANLVEKFRMFRKINNEHSRKFTGKYILIKNYHTQNNSQIVQKKSLKIENTKNRNFDL
jgi:hypothetical protein